MNGSSNVRERTLGGKGNIHDETKQPLFPNNDEILPEPSIGLSHSASSKVYKLQRYEGNNRCCCAVDVDRPMSVCGTVPYFVLGLQHPTDRVRQDKNSQLPMTVHIPYQTLIAFVPELLYVADPLLCSTFIYYPWVCRD